MKGFLDILSVPVSYKTRRLIPRRQKQDVDKPLHELHHLIQPYPREVPSHLAPTGKVISYTLSYLFFPFSSSVVRRWRSIRDPGKKGRSNFNFHSRKSRWTALTFPPRTGAPLRTIYLHSAESGGKRFPSGGKRFPTFDGKIISFLLFVSMYMKGVCSLSVLFSHFVGCLEGSRIVACLV